MMISKRLALMIALCACFCLIAFPAQAQRRGYNSPTGHAIGATLQLNLFSLQGTADYEMKGEVETAPGQTEDFTVDGDGDFDQDPAFGIGLNYLYIAPQNYFLGAEIVMHNISGEADGKVEGKIQGQSYSQKIDGDYDLKQTRLGFIGGYYFKPAPLRPYAQGGLAMNMETLDLDDGEDDDATVFSISAAGGVDYFSGQWLFGGGARIDYYINEEFELSEDDIDSTVTIHRIPLLIFGRVAYLF